MLKVMSKAALSYFFLISCFTLLIRVVINLTEFPTIFHNIR